MWKSISRSLATTLLIAAALGLTACGDEPADTPGPEGNGQPDDSPAVAREPFENEKHLTNLRQLTFAGENAEAYWSFDEKQLIFQSTRDGRTVDQIYTMKPDGSDVKLVSTGKGLTTCSYFLPGDERILYASTHAAGDEPPKKPPFRGYVWGVFNSYAIYTAKPDGSDVQLLQGTDRYDAEATVSPAGDRIVFTSTRDDDLDLYSMKIDGSDVKRLTTAPGYDGGAFFSWDGKKIVWRAPNRDSVDLKETKDLLARELVRPNKLEIWIMDADGSNKQMITNNGAANFAPFWHPDGKRIIFASNMDDPKRRNFEIYLVDIETRKTERITYFERTRPGAQRRSDDFDAFPMFTRDGNRLVFCSNRHNEKPNETNVFVADWVN